MYANLISNTIIDEDPANPNLDIEVVKTEFVNIFQTCEDKMIIFKCKFKTDNPQKYVQNIFWENLIKNIV